MNVEPQDDDPLAELRRRATLREFTFVSGAPVVGGLMARLRAAWNSVATKWQARPVMAQQSAFNRALADWLAQPPNAAEVDERLIAQDHRQTALSGEMARLTAQARWARGERAERRPRLAYFSPLPPSPSGIADYSAELLPHLAELADITLFSDQPEVDILGLPSYATGDYPALRHAFDLPLYQMGNSDRHEAMFAMMMQYPGVVVLHDYFLHHFIHYHTVGRGDWPGYEREMAYAGGRDGRRRARAIRDNQATFPLFDEPLNARLIDAAVGLIVHSDFAARRARAARPGLRAAVIAAPVAPHPGRSRRAQLGVADDAVIFGSFGQLTAEKRIDTALRAFRRVREQYPHSRFLLAGGAQPDIDLPRLLADLQLADAVIAIGHVAELGEFVDWIHTADVVVNLRQPTVGETSAVALRALAAARPVVVYDHGWYAELPDAVALKVPPGDEDALFAAMERLAASAALRRALGEAGEAYIQAHHQPQQVARATIDFVLTILAGGSAYA
ncbi:protein of unknown function [Candidatus Promineifilum breve]|uniref:Glycosyltransferase n=1 Tax=Candidatus Promineifilum breve TaxID=1806508 RepID=A0A160T604_9CHLR|nr:glycosyltransferase [Candidatus Promineifilum breve]CUS04939.2 protein of unknown function [Candidatus Promineifilum breve]